MSLGSNHRVGAMAALSSFISGASRFARLFFVVLFLSLSLPGAIGGAQASLYEDFLDACGGSGTCGVKDYVDMAYEKMRALYEESAFLKKIVEWFSIEDKLLEMQASIAKYLGIDMQVAQATDAAAAGGAQKALAKEREVLAQAELDASVENTEVAGQVDAALKSSRPVPTDQFLCNKITACQGPVTMERFAQIVSKMVAEGVALRFRGEGADGNGPQVFADDAAVRCGQNGTGEPLGNPIDGERKGCAAASPTSSTSFADMDISSTILDFSSVLQVPHMTKKTKDLGNGKTVIVNEPDLASGSQSPMDIAEKKSFLIAVEYCAKLAGPRPSPPSGAALNSPDGRTKLVNWNRCAARQSEFVKICADRVGLLARPDCGDSDFAGICEASLPGCNAARAAEIDLPPSFRNCAAGASLYQAEYMCNTMCKSSRQYQSKARHGGKDAAALADMTLCKVSESVWNHKMAVKEAVFTQAVAGMQDMDRCWATAE